MGEIEIVAECNKCETQFDDEDDVKICIFCNDNFCENCQSEHSQEILFISENYEIKNYLQQKYNEILKNERTRVRKLKNAK